MAYEERLTDLELEKIMSEGMIYMCACPAQVAQSTRTVRELYRYQMACLGNPENDGRVHQAIARSAIAAHAELQACMELILVLENWDRATLSMPENLRVKQIKAITDD